MARAICGESAGVQGAVVNDIFRFSDLTCTSRRQISRAIRYRVFSGIARLYVGKDGADPV